MTRSMEIFYLTLPVDNADQALSLSEYLNQHGILAAPEGKDSVTCPMDDPAKTSLIHQLRKSWGMYWEHSDAALFGLPVMIKDSDGGCAHCGTGPKVE